jgi:glutamate-1-semialdehyde 2,1-aminomutase
VNGIPETTHRNVETLPFGDAQLLAEKLEREGDEIAAVLTEAVMSNCGLVRPPDGYLERVRQLTREHDVLLILDEVVTGFRMGPQGAQGHYDLDPDLAVFGKALANGYPNAAVTGHRDIMEFIEADSEKASFSGTFSGNPLVIAATKACLEEVQDIGDSGYERFLNRGQRLVEGLREIGADMGHEVFVPDFAGYTYLHFHDGETDPETWTEWRQVDRHVNFDTYRQFAAEMIGQGVYFIPRVGRINISHAHTDEHINQALEAAKTAFERVR